MRDGLFLKFGKRTFSDPQKGMEYAIDQIRDAWGDEVQVVSRVLRDYLDNVAQTLKDRHSEPWSPGGSSDNLMSRTGRGAESIVRSVSVKGTTWENLSGTIGGRKYLAIHESGGYIRAKGKLLTIPLPAAMSNRGTSPPFARQWKDTFVARSRKGNLLIFQRRGDGIVPLYVLKNEVYIPPRLGMRQELEDQLPYFASRVADEVVEDIMSRLE